MSGIAVSEIQKPSGILTTFDVAVNQVAVHGLPAGVKSAGIASRCCLVADRVAHPLLRAQVIAPLRQTLEFERESKRL